jgi:hypothetical protein
MKLSIVRTNDSDLDVFTNLVEASAFANANAKQRDYSTEVLGTYAVPGSPDSRPVWIVIFGDRGFIGGCRGAFLNEDHAVALAASMEARCEYGMSFWAVKIVLDRPARSDAVGGAKYCRAPREEQPGYRAPREDQPRAAKGAAKPPCVTEVDDESPTPSKATGAAEGAAAATKGATDGATKGAAKVPDVIVVEDDDEPLTLSKADGAFKDREGALADSEVAGVEVEPLTPPNKRRRF